MLQVKSSSQRELHRFKKEIIEKPIGLSLNRREIGSNPPCSDCQAKGAILCVTCSGSGLYVDSILESQGILVKVKCLGKHFIISSSVYHCYHHYFF
ncbi:hypothetical protein MA16_Dca008257 [Dendrobium catenatum]|uniref:DnaJ/Hsp40 cysteine-rich domain superfamily protein n=1 Tax=Dendrobium catenatum TaxID=906689 RepID=A0A2I0X6Q0_9ASPA|nr:hypothetical protein MA16_Dca008257 [Dendrobium catenatum]